MGIGSWVKIDSNHVCLNGENVNTGEKGKELLVALYRKYIKDYPKFFKMDTLSRLGVVACDLLMGSKEIADGDKENMSIILFNAAGSIANDSSYQKTIVEDNYFPSPAVFVYTLPNIVTGEIAIRHKIYGETSFYITKDADATQIFDIVNSSLPNDGTGTCICGWLECKADDDFEATLFLLDNSNDCLFNIENINRIINY
ncbi:MAG: hypothetical protein IJZ22_01420 [Bacteroidaceae bacterium]|nr:hypothetical protein [Bacteroidaceae bacterium]